MSDVAIPDMGKALDEVVDLLNDALDGTGWVATWDERDLNVPGVLVGPGQPDWLTLNRLDDSTVEATWEVWLVARDLGPARSLSTLTQMLRAVATRLPVGTVQALPLILPNHGDALPALAFDLTLEVTEE